jgi:hypothetical protein
LEIHRSNFIGAAAMAELSRGEMDRLYREALRRWPSLAFLSTQTLGATLTARDPLWIETGLRRRLGAWSARAAMVPGLARRLGLLGLGWLLRLGSGSGGCH